MKYIKDLKEGDRVSDIYLCKHKQSAVTKNGKAYENVILQEVSVHRYESAVYTGETPKKLNM